MAKIKANKKITGTMLGVRFKDGEAESDSPAALAFFRGKDGYKVSGKVHTAPPEPVLQPEATPPGPPDSGK